MKVDRTAWAAPLALLATGCVDYEVCTSHYPEGPAMSVRYYEDGVAHRPWVVWTDDKRERLETHYEHGARSGDWRTVGLRGDLFLRSYEEDQPSGTWRRNWAEGQPQEEGSFRKGLKHGVWKKWLPTGELVEQAEFAEGVWDGRVQRWSATGELEFEGLYARGVRVGE